MRQFETGATRDQDESKLDYEGFLSPLVLQRYAEYMHLHRRQADGVWRDSDNWQKGMPLESFMKSQWRHMMDQWLEHRGFEGREDIEEAICGVMFNAMGYLHEVLKAKYNGTGLQDLPSFILQKAQDTENPGVVL